MPLMANMSVVLISNVVVCLWELVAHTELGYKSWIVGALL